MNSWFHYAKLYAATIGCIGFMAIKYSWGAIGKAHWFKCFPFVIVAINILIAVVSDFESAIRAWGTTWVSSEGVTLYGGWHNVFNGVAGIINIACMTGWFGIYISKKRQDMLWPDMTWVFIIAYDLWNFCYTYNCLPTHSWYCGLALLLAPTVAAFFWNKGGWIQNRAFTLAIWCMFAQCVPAFQDYSVFSVQSVNNPNVNLAVSVIALLANIAAFAYIMYRAKKPKVNPYMNEVFAGTKDYDKAMAPRRPRGAGGIVRNQKTDPCLGSGAQFSFVRRRVSAFAGNEVSTVQCAKRNLCSPYPSSSTTSPCCSPWRRWPPSSAGVSNSRSTLAGAWWPDSS